jgi:hypothetical protein
MMGAMRDIRTHHARPAPAARRWRPGPRVLRILLIALAGFYVPYLIGANILLRTQLIQKVIDGALVGSTAGIKVTYDSIWTFFPGQVWVRGAVVRGHDYHIEWEVRVDNHVAWIDPLSFAHRTFRVLRARGTGVEFRLRMRRNVSEIGDETLAMLPSIEGYADPPLHPDVPRPPRIKADAKMWSVRLDDVLMKDVRVVWIETFHWTDSGTIRGGFAFTPGQALFVHGALSVKDGELRRGDVTLLDHTRGRTRVAILPIDLGKLDGHTFLRRLILAGNLYTELHSLAMIPALGRAGVTEVTVDARLAVAGRLGLGVLASGTAIWLSIARAEARVGKVRIAVNGEAKVHVRAASPLGRGALVGYVDLAPVAMERVDSAGPALLHGGLRVGFESPTVDLGEPIDPGKITVDGYGRLADAGLVGAWLPDSIVAPSGAATFDVRGRMDTADASGAGRIRIDAPALSFKLQDLSVRGHLSTDIILSGIAFPAGPTRASSAVFHLDGSHLDLHGVSITKADRAATEENWWLRLDVPSALLRPGASAVRARLVTRFRDADPILMLLDRSLHAPAVMLKPLTRAEFDARATLRIRPGLFALEGLDVDGGTFTMEGWYRRAKGVRSGAFLAEMGGLALGVDVTPDKVRVEVRTPRKWYAGVVAPH